MVVSAAAGSIAARLERREHELGERLKELACLHAIADLFAAPGVKLPRVLAAECRTIRYAFQYPDRIGVRIVFRGRTFRTRAFRDAGPCLQTPLRPQGRSTGSVTVRYVTGRPRGGTLPFLPAERRLLRSLARLTENLIVRVEAEESLRAAGARLLAQKRRLERKNVALTELVSLIEASRHEVRAAFAAELADAALPALRKLRDPDLDPEQRARLIGLAERAVQGAGSPFTRRIASAHAALSPREAEICDLLASGSTSKDIARILHVSPATVESHRHNIRRKLGLVGGGANLTSWLRAGR
jgi:DNA-binding CsgD family transcriptional regulator